VTAGVSVAGGTEPLPETPPEVAKAQPQLKVLQWVIPALTGGILISSRQTIAAAGTRIRAPHSSAVTVAGYTDVVGGQPKTTTFPSSAPTPSPRCSVTTWVPHRR
jgi:hypothetical protein